MEWYKNITFYLKYNQLLVELSSKERKALKMNVTYCVLISKVIFRISIDDMLLRCLGPLKVDDVFMAMHDGAYKGHLAPLVISHRVIRAGFYCLKSLLDPYRKVRSCVACQKFKEQMEIATMPLNTINVDTCFAHWGLYVIDP
jgi:hypothetical protein